MGALHYLVQFMSQLFDRIHALIVEGKYAIGKHAAERLEERSIL